MLFPCFETNAGSSDVAFVKSSKICSQLGGLGLGGKIVFFFNMLQYKNTYLLNLITTCACNTKYNNI